MEESRHRVYLRREDMCPKKVIDKLVLDSDAYCKGTENPGDIIEGDCWRRGGQDTMHRGVRGSLLGDT